MDLKKLIASLCFLQISVQCQCHASLQHFASTDFLGSGWVNSPCIGKGRHSMNLEKFCCTLLNIFSILDHSSYLSPRHWWTSSTQTSWLVRWLVTIQIISSVSVFGVWTECSSTMGWYFLKGIQISIFFHRIFFQSLYFLIVFFQFVCFHSKSPDSPELPDSPE